MGDETGSLADVEAMYKNHLASFRRVAAAVSGDRDSACDIVQEAFVRAVRELHTFRGGGSLHGWLWRIVVNTARNHRRDTRPTVELSPGLAVTTNGHEPGEAERVRAAIGLLPERQRLVLFLRFYADLDYGAIAQAAEISPGTVGATLSQARAALHQLLSMQEATP